MRGIVSAMLAQGDSRKLQQAIDDRGSEAARNHPCISGGKVQKCKDIAEH